jgi:hypothetical protein
MSKKTKTNQNTTMTYGFQTAPETPDVQAARTAATDNTPDPSIQFHAAQQKQQLNNSLSNPFGGNVSPETLDAIRYARQADIDTQAGQATQEDAFRRRQTRFGNLYAMAGLTQPRLVQTGGSMTGTVSQPIWPGLLQSGISAGIGAAI